MPVLSYSVLLNRSTWNTAPIISGLLFFTKCSQNYHIIFTNRVYYIDNETRGAKLLSNKTAFGATEVIKIRPYRKSVIQTDGGYTQLWIAVINQAVNDYRNSPDMRSEVARFFKSEYFERMTGVSGQVVLDRLKKEVKQNKNNIK